MCQRRQAVPLATVAGRRLKPQCAAPWSVGCLSASTCIPAEKASSVRYLVGSPAPIGATGTDPDFDFVLLLGSVWADHAVTAPRTYLAQTCASSNVWPFSEGLEAARGGRRLDGHAATPDGTFCEPARGPRGGARCVHPLASRAARQRLSACPRRAPLSPYAAEVRGCRAAAGAMIVNARLSERQMARTTSRPMAATSGTPATPAHWPTM